MGRTQHSPYEQWDEIAPLDPEPRAAFEALAQSELANELYPYLQFGCLCRLHARPIAASEEDVPAIYLNWHRVHRRFRLAVYDGNGNYQRTVTEVCTAGRFLDLLRILTPILAGLENGIAYPVAWHWPETEAACLEHPGSWVLGRIPPAMRFRKEVCRLALEAPRYCSYPGCDCSHQVRRLFLQRGDGWLECDRSLSASLWQTAQNPCRPHCVFAAFLAEFVQFVRGARPPGAFYELLPRLLDYWHDTLANDTLANRLELEEWRKLRAEREAAQMEILRDLVGNPFSPVVVPAHLLTWRSGAIHALARGIYEDEAFADMPILADALEEADAPEQLVEHCRQGGPHFRGCWALDLLAPELTARCDALAAQLPLESKHSVRSV